MNDQTYRPSVSRARLASGITRLVREKLEREPDLTRAELAQRMLPGCTEASAQSLLRTYCARGGHQWPRAEQLDSIAAGLGVDVSELFADVGIASDTVE